ncbi:MAG: site-specific integrase, partial [Deltaproteobacteria bacterium]|nr:site-specific integrase [Deltaproteobacteria bacterium]
ATARKRLERADELEVDGLRLGRYPFASAIPYYMDSRYGEYAETTFIETKRKLRYLAKVFEGLKQQGMVKSTDPRHIKRKEIQELLMWMKRKGLDPTAQAKLLTVLKGFLKFFRNHIIEEMKVEGVKFPKSTNKPIRVIEDDDLRRILEAPSRMEGWKASMAKGMIALYFATGVRPKELRLAHFEDLDLENRRLYVRHPKGEGSWASRDEVDILRPDMIPLVKEYLKEREEHIRKKGLARATALFPSLCYGKDAFYTANGFSIAKKKVEKVSGVKFKLKDFRSTLTSMTVKDDLSRLPAMSAHLRHCKLETTQRYYARIDRGVAGRQLRDAWKDHPILAPNTSVEPEQEIPIIARNPVIDRKYELTGYV